MIKTILVFSILIHTLFATDYFVDGRKGYDSNTGSLNKPFKTISKAIGQADNPGDVVNILSGIYKEPVHTESNGSANKPIIIQAYKKQRVEIISAGKALKLDNEHIVIKDIVFNGAWAERPVCDINQDNVKIIGCEFKNSKRDIITISSVENVVIEDCKIHHGFSWYYKTKKEPHGISTDGVKNLIIKDCEIYQITGDCIQISPTRSNWDNVLIEGCTFWVSPISQKESHEAGLPEQAIGQILAENAIDLKADEDDSPDVHRIKIKNCSAYGFYSTRIKNAAAFNIKNPVSCILEGIKSWNNEIAMRLRFPAEVTVLNSLFYDNTIAIRFEDDMKKLHLIHNTFGTGTKKHLREIGNMPDDFVAINNLFSGKKLPREIIKTGNEKFNMAIHPKKIANFFVNPQKHDYHLQKKSPAIDSGKEVHNIKTDLEKRKRPQNGKYDLGAYEY
jgi:hypothetical protein